MQITLVRQYELAFYKISDASFILNFMVGTSDAWATWAVPLAVLVERPGRSTGELETNVYMRSEAVDVLRSYNSGLLRDYTLHCRIGIAMVEVRRDVARSFRSPAIEYALRQRVSRIALHGERHVVQDTGSC